jgi:hypothetical protein
MLQSEPLSLYIQGHLANLIQKQRVAFSSFEPAGAAGFQSIITSDCSTEGSRFWSVGPTVQWKIFDAPGASAPTSACKTRGRSGRWPITSKWC